MRDGLRLKPELSPKEITDPHSAFFARVRWCPYKAFLRDLSGLCGHFVYRLKSWGLVYQTYYTEPTVNLRLRKGWNHLLIKIENQGNDWGFLVRCADADGTPITDLDLFPQPTPLTMTRGTFERTLAVGLNFISLPLRPDTPFTAQSMINRMGVSGDGDCDHAGTVR